MYCVNGEDDNFKLYNTTVYQVGIDPPDSKPTVGVGSGTGLTGTYQYKYTYKRDTEALEGNPSPVSDEVTVSDEDVDVTVVASSDTQVDKIVIYRTLNLDSGGDSTQFYKVDEVENSDQTYTDSASDNDVTTLVSDNHTVPPKAKFVKLHNDRMFYISCPDETDGESMVMWSLVGIPEAVPSSNYQYFDRKDGEEITGVASLGEQLVIFKPNKISVLSGNFDELYTVSRTIGSISGYSILEFKDNIVFLSEDGWKAYDGVNISDISDRLRALDEAGYFTPAESDNYDAVYYPLKKQMMFLINHSSLAEYVMVGHWIVPLMAEVKIEDLSQDYVGWTYFQYESLDLSCLGAYTDDEGLRRPLAGGEDGYLYRLDSGAQDDGSDINFRFETGFRPLGQDPTTIFTLREVTIMFQSGTAGGLEFNVDVDNVHDVSVFETVTGGEAYAGSCYAGEIYCGMSGLNIESFNVNAMGRLFQVGLDVTTSNTFTLAGLSGALRPEAKRPS